MIKVDRPILELVADVKAGQITAVQLAQACLDAAKHNEEYHALLELNPDALAQAEAIDARVAAGEDVGALAGVPYIAKDNFLTAEGHTTAASNILKPFKAPYESTAILRLRDAGAILIGKANMDAFGHGSSTENSDFGPTKNPVDPARVPGGSSGGSAAAVKLGLCSFSLATDTGGSIRQPASLSGVVGFKPTYGLVSRSGVVAMGSSFDTIGVLAHRSVDVATVLDVIAGKDPLDATTIERDHNLYAEQFAELKSAKIAVITEYLGAGIDPEVKASIMKSVEALRAAGATVEEISIPALELALASYYITVPAEVSSNLARYDGVRYGHSSDAATSLGDTYLKSRNEGFGAEAKRRILIGTYVLSSGYYDAYYKKAQQVRTLLISQFNDAFSKYDLLVGPVAPQPAFKLGETEDPLAMYLGDIATVAVNLVGVPAMSIPTYEVRGLPVGLQLIAAQRNEGKLLGLARAAEEALV